MCLREESIFCIFYVNHSFTWIAYLLSSTGWHLSACWSCLWCDLSAFVPLKDFIIDLLCWHLIFWPGPITGSGAIINKTNVGKGLTRALWWARLSDEPPRCLKMSNNGTFFTRSLFGYPLCLVFSRGIKRSLKKSNLTIRRRIRHLYLCLRHSAYRIETVWSLKCTVRLNWLVAIWNCNSLCIV